MGKKTQAKRRRKYHLKPSAKRFYTRAGLVLAGVLAVVVLLRLTVLKTTYTLRDYSAAAPFEIGAQVLDRINPKNPEDLVIMDVFLTLDNSASLKNITVKFTELISKNSCREWTLDIKGEQAKLSRGDKLSADLTSQRGRFPPLSSTLSALSRIPYSKIAAEQSIGQKQQLLLSTKSFRPNVNPVFSDSVKDSVVLWWVSANSAMSQVDASYTPVSDYMAVECFVQDVSGQGEDALKYVILMETT